MFTTYPDAPWMDIAQLEIGQKEISGNQHNPRILEYHKSTTLKATQDEVPWCSAFVTWVLTMAGYKSTASAWARSYLNYGIKLDKPRPGCIVIFSRGSDSGHVAFFVKSNLLTITVLGGNQNNQVCYAKYFKYRILGYRWPVKAVL